MPFSFDPIFAKDPSNPNVVAARAAITIFDPADNGKAPIAITDPTGVPLPNPITVDGQGMGPAFQHPTLARVGWHGGGYTNYFTSYEGLRDEAVAARNAAQTAQGEATAAAGDRVTTAAVTAGKLILTKASGGTVDAGSVIGPKGDKGDKGVDGSNVLPTDAAIKQAITTPGTETATALTSTIATWLDKAYPVDIIVVGGQSNSTKADWYDVPPETVDGWVMKWVPGETAPTPFAADDSQLGQFFAQEYVRQFPRRRVLVVTAGVGDTGFRLDKSGGTWDRSDTTNATNLYNRMVTATNAAKAWVTANTTSPSTQVKAVLWSGFEADSKVFTQAAWRAKMTDLISAYRTAMGDTFNRIPFVFGSMTPELFYEYTEALPRGVRWAIEDMPRWIQHTSYVFGPRNTSKYGERIHFSVEGQRRRARLFIEGLRRARVNYTSTTQKPITPTGLNVERNGSNVLITWDAPYSRATRYELRVSTDEGVTWTDVTLPRPLMHEYATTVAATTPLWARVRSVNDTLFSEWSFPAPTMPEPARPGTPLYSLTSRDLLTTTDLTSWTPTAGTAAGTVLNTPSGVNGPDVVQDLGINVVQFNGTTERLSTAGATDVWKTMYAVVKLGTSTGTDWIFGAEQASNPYVGWDSTAGMVYAYNGTATSISVAATAGWHFIAYTIDTGGVATLTVDGVSVSGTLATTAPAPGLRLAGSFGTGQFAAVSFADLQPLATVASAGDITAQRAWSKRVYPMLLP